VHVLGLYRHDSIHLDVKPVVVLCIVLLSGEDVVLLDVGFFRVVPGSFNQMSVMVLISLPFSWLAQRRPWQLLVPSLKVFGETALARDVTRRLV
jgi:hypothetical protein